MLSIILRKCVLCGKEAHNEGELDLFVPNLPSKYQKQNLCRECNHKIQKDYKEKNKNTLLPKKREHMKQYYPEHRQKYLQNALEYRKQNPEKRKAHNKVKRQPLESECSNCGSTESLLRHHPDYSLPTFFITLYSSCHRKFHSRGLGE